MMLISKRPRNDGGFTLIELLVVLAIIGLLTTLVITRVGQKPAALVRSEAALRLQGAIGVAKRAARETGLPQSVKVETVVKEAVWKSDAPKSPELVVYPDGSATGGSVMLGDRPLITLNWLTGEAKGS